MVSAKQSNSDGTTYDSEAEKMLDKPDNVLKACIDGLQTVEDCQEWIEAEVNGKARKGVIARLNRRKAELEQ